jgi:SPP1 family predicted phage head-tail adaptor
VLFRDVLELISVTNSADGMGGNVETKTSRQVFANKKSIRQKEFYEAHTAGLKPELMFVVRTVEYEGEEILSYDGKEYNIIRSYDKNGELTELICSKV